jgi:predicted DNA-binding transcriptional regulator AlpA
VAVTNILLEMLKSGQPVFYDLRTAIRAALASGVSERDILSMVTVTASELDTNGHGGNGHDLPVFTDLPDGLIDLPTAADRYGHSRQLLWQWVTQGRLPERGLLRRPGSTVANIVVAEADLKEPTKNGDQDLDGDLPIFNELPAGLIDVPTAVKQFGCQNSTLRRWIAKGLLPAHGRLRAPAPGGGYLVVSEEELVKHLSEPRKKGGRPRKTMTNC